MRGRSSPGSIAAVVLTVAGLALPAGCDWMSDPAVRLAYCLESAVRGAKPDTVAIQTSCDLKLRGSYLVVLHPDGELGDEQLTSGGVSAAVIPELRALRIGHNASIYVISIDPGVTGIGTGRTVLSSRTTYQTRFVGIDHLIALAKTSQPLGVDIRGPAGARVIQGLR